MQTPHEPGVFKRTLDIRVTALAVVGVAAALLIAAYFCVDKPDREHVKFVSAVVAGSAGLYGAFYAGAALRFAAAQEKQKRSFEILDALAAVDKVRLRQLVETVDKKGHGDRKVFKLIRDDPELWESASICLGMLEDMAIAVRHGYADERILYDSLAAVADRLVSKLGGFISKLRELRGNAKLYKEIEDLVAFWRAGKLLSSGRSLTE